MAAVTVECAGCGRRWEVPPKPDGTMPQTARCPRAQGGCGKLRKLPRRAVRPEGALAPCPRCAANSDRARVLAVALALTLAVLATERR